MLADLLNPGEGAAALTKARPAPHASTIREAGLRDLDALTAIENQCFSIDRISRSGLRRFMARSCTSSDGMGRRSKSSRASSCIGSSVVQPKKIRNRYVSPADEVEDACEAYFPEHMSGVLAYAFERGWAMAREGIFFFSTRAPASASNGRKVQYRPSNMHMPVSRL